MKSLRWLIFIPWCLIVAAEANQDHSRIRGGYMSQSNMKLFQPMQRAGMNTAIVKFGQLAVPVTSGDAKSLQEFASESARLGVSFIPVINWWGDNEPHWLTSYDHFVTSTGTVLPKTPCPYSAALWDQVVTSRFLAIIAAIPSPAIKFVCLDPEMYGADDPLYKQDCFCDRCYARFLRATNRTMALPPVAERARIINEGGEINAYRTVERDTARQLAAECRNAVTKARPGVRIGVFDADLPYPFYEGIVQGFASRQSPLLCFTEHTYTDGYTAYLAATQEKFRSMGAAVDLVVGIYQSKFVPEEIASQLYHCARTTAGYWIYTMDTFASPNFRPLVGSREQYWRAIERADNELDRLATNAKYVSSLTVRPKVVPGLPFLRIYVLPPGKQVSAAPPRLWLRGNNWVHFWASRGETIDFELSSRQLGKYADVVLARLVSPEGDPMVEATVRLNESATIHVPSTQDGLYELVLQAGLNAVEITRVSHPFSIGVPAGGGGAFLTVHVPVLYVPILSGASRAVLELATPATAQQAANVTVTSDDGSPRWSGVVHGVVRVTIENPRGAYLRIDTKEVPSVVLQDFHVKAIEGLLPLAAPRHEWLLQPAK
jgi:hypothetical protein